MSAPHRIAERFELPGPLVEACAHGSGHIHDTFVVSCTRSGSPAPARFLLQRLNTRVFRDPDGVMRNLVRIAAHLERGLLERRVADAERRFLAPLPAREGGLLVTDADGGRWRAFPFQEDTRACDLVESPAQAYEGARAFAEFAARLADLPPPPLVETIPRFHDLSKRMRDLRRAARQDAAGRAGGAGADLESCEQWLARIDAALAAAGFARVPRRVVHNDCKLNNVLFDARTGEGLCVIDLDTTMEGTVLCDFGELVRTAAISAAEDEVDPVALHLDLALFSALARGYLAGFGGALAPEEIGVLPLAGPVMALENAIRFLADHLSGDSYFRIAREGHNLDRCRSQLLRVELLWEARGELARHVQEAAGAAG